MCFPVFAGIHNHGDMEPVRTELTPAITTIPARPDFHPLLDFCRHAFQEVRDACVDFVEDKRDVIFAGM